MQTAKLFQNGQSQAVRLPREFRFEGKEVIIKRVSNAVLLLPLTHAWDCLFDSLTEFSADFMEERAQPAAQQQREDMFG